MARVPKNSGEYRIIAVPTVRDRLVQRVMLRHLEADPQFNANSSISFGFTKGRTLADAQRRALELRQARPWVLQADIIKFFDRVPRSEIKTLIRRRVGWKVVANLLCGAVDCELESGGDVGAAGAIAAGVRRGQGLRQGMPVSPLLSNLLLKGFDEALAKQNIVAIRYADDIAVFATCEKECRDALSLIQAKLAKLELNVHDLSDDSKTTLSRPSEVVQFLGVEIRRLQDRYKLYAPNKKLSQIEADMAAMVSLKACVQARRNIGQVVRALDSFIIGHAASMAVLADGGDFLSRLEAAKRRQLRYLLVALIGRKAVKALDHDRLAVLGLGSFRG